MPVTTEELKGLSAPTPDSEKKQRPAPGGSGKMLTYIDARYVMDRLDAVCGMANWQSKFEDTAIGGVRCGIGINIEDVGWVWKWDVGDESTIEPTKGAHSDALKRAGVHWDIARDLYEDRSPTATFRTSTGVPAVASGGALPPAAGPVAGRMATAPLVSDWTCPIHGSYKVVPAGTSKRTLRPYPAFVVCGEQGCEQKPGRGEGALKPKPVYAGMSEYPVDEDESWVGHEEYGNN